MIKYSSNIFLVPNILLNVFQKICNNKYIIVSVSNKCHALKAYQKCVEVQHSPDFHTG
jgi:hypothetical protein